jgi:hypothetical protein
VSLTGQRSTSLASLTGARTRVSWETQFQEIGRVALFSGPNDGEGNSEHWRPSHYIQEIDGITNTRYYGLVHYLNNAKSYLPSDNVLFKVTENWPSSGWEDCFSRPIARRGPGFR